MGNDESTRDVSVNDLDTLRLFYNRALKREEELKVQWRALLDRVRDVGGTAKIEAPEGGMPAELIITPFEHPAETKLQELTGVASTFAENFVAWSLNDEGSLDCETIESAFELCESVGVYRKDDEEKE